MVSGFSQTSLVRAVDASYIAPAVNIYVEKTIIAGNVGEGYISNDGATAPSPAALVSVTAATGGATLVSTAVTLKPGARHSVFLTHNGSSPRYCVTAIKDQSIPAAGGHSDFRFLNQAPRTGTLDVYMVPTLPSRGLLNSKRMRQIYLTPAILALVLFASSASSASVQKARVVRSYPHDASAFTQGLVFADGHLYESTGLYGHSSLRMVNFETGRSEQSIAVPGRYFAEGLTAWGSTLIQLTWQEHIAFVYDRFSFRQLRTMSYPWEGWGLTNDGRSLILSDGSATLRFLDPDTMKLRRSIIVTDRGRRIDKLNELEYVKGEIYANVWYSDRIARIDPASGKVLGWIDLSGLLPDTQRSSEAVLNGIAYDPARHRLFVTGKLWPKLFEIQVIPAAGRKNTQ